MFKKEIEFHIEVDDYFGTLATALSLIKQSLEKNKNIVNVLEKAERDLVYLQKNYQIVKKK